jgi:hypothetical protein
MESKRYTIGRIDRLVLQKAAAEKGMDILKKRIKAHKFTETIVIETMPPQYEQTSKPYVIEQVVKKADQSPLSQAVFNTLYTMYVHEMGILFPGNPLNAHYQKGNFHSSDRIDYCTSAATLDGSYLGNAHAVKIRTEFYNKHSLLKALKRLD